MTQKMAKWSLGLSSLGYQFKSFWFTKDRKPVSNMGGWVICWNNETDLGWDFQSIPEVPISLGTFENPSLSSFSTSQSHSQSIKSSLYWNQWEFCPWLQQGQNSDYSGQVLLCSFLFYSSHFPRRGLTVFEVQFSNSSGIFYCIPAYVLLLALWVGEQWEAALARKSWKQESDLSMKNTVLDTSVCLNMFSKLLVML